MGQLRYDDPGKPSEREQLIIAKWMHWLDLCYCFSGAVPPECHADVAFLARGVNDRTRQ